MYAANNTLASMKKPNTGSKEDCITKGSLIIYKDSDQNIQEAKITRIEILVDPMFPQFRTTADEINTYVCRHSNVIYILSNGIEIHGNQLISKWANINITV